MTPPRSLTRMLVQAPIFRDAPKRRTLFVVLLLVFGVLSFFPERFRAAVSLTPTDPTSLGLSSTLGQLGAVTNIFGNQTVIEVSLKVARSQYVRAIVAGKLGLPKKLGKSPLDTDRWLDKEVEIRALRGGIIQFEMKSADAEFARTIVAGYADAVREQLAIIDRNQTAYKRQIVVALVEKASDRLAHAQAAYDEFRLTTRYSSPQSAIAAVGNRIPQLESSIRLKEVELGAARRFGTDQNLRVQQIQAEIAALQRQLATARSTSEGSPSSVGRVVIESTEADRLRRELDVAQTLYDNYRRILQGTTVEDLASSANVRVLEPAYIDSERQINFIPMMLGILTLLIALVCEFYLLRPPVEYKAAA